jgi:hypothetical protein
MINFLIRKKHYLTCYISIILGKLVDYEESDRLKLPCGLQRGYIIEDEMEFFPAWEPDSGTSSEETSDPSISGNSFSSFEGESEPSDGSIDEEALAAEDAFYGRT